MSAHRILLAISTSRYSAQLVSSAMEEAEKNRKAGRAVAIDVLYVIETEDLERVSSMVGDEGFLGLAPQREVLHALATEHDRTAMGRITEIEAAAREANIPVEVHRVDGRFAEAVVLYAEQHRADIILLTRADRPWISRFLFGSEADRVARIARRDGLGQVIIDGAA